MPEEMVTSYKRVGADLLAPLLPGTSTPRILHVWVEYGALALSCRCRLPAKHVTVPTVRLRCLSLVSPLPQLSCDYNSHRISAMLFIHILYHGTAV